MRHGPRTTDHGACQSFIHHASLLGAPQMTVKPLSMHRSGTTAVSEMWFSKYSTGYSRSDGRALRMPCIMHDSSLLWNEREAGPSPVRDRAHVLSAAVSRGGALILQLYSMYPTSRGSDGGNDVLCAA